MIPLETLNWSEVDVDVNAGAGAPKALADPATKLAPLFILTAPV